MVEPAKSLGSSSQVVGVGCALLVLVIVIAAVVSNGGGSSSTAPEHSAVEAYTACQGFVRDRLKAPSTADFPWVKSSDVTESLGDGRYRVRSYVDAQNSFGAMIRNSYDCTVRYRSGAWTAESVLVGGG